MKKRIWITWENQRRSVELSQCFQSKLYVLLEPFSLGRIFRYAYLLVATTSVLVRERPQIVFVQNPSIVLACFVASIRNILKFKLIVDRHSNFKLDLINNELIQWKIFHLLSKFSVGSADITIVTNDYLKKLVNEWGGTGVVLQDKFPELIWVDDIALKGKKNIVVISSFDDDEPIDEIVEAATLLPEGWILYITGEYRKHYKEKIKHELKNIIFTGFVDEQKYQKMLNSCDAIVALTKQEYTLNCGAYEAIALAKPVVLSDTVTIKEYFNKGVVYVKSDPVSIATGIKQAVLQREELIKNIKKLKVELDKKWWDRFSEIIDEIDRLFS